MSNSVWKGPFRYQLTSMLKAAGVMVLIVVAVQIFFSVIAASAAPGEPIYSNAQESSSLIFCFVLGCCMWKESFHLSMASGITRRDIFLATLTSLLTLCVVLVPVELLLSFLINQFLDAPTLFFLIYGQWGNAAASFSSAGFVVQGALLQIAGSLALAYAGFFLGVVFYVVPKWLRVVLAIAIPITLFAGLPSLLLLLPHAQLEALLNTLELFFRAPGNVTLACLAAAVLFALLAWIPAHRAALMRNPQPSAATSD